MLRSTSILKCLEWARAHIVIPNMKQLLRSRPFRVGYASMEEDQPCGLLVEASENSVCVTACGKGGNERHCLFWGVYIQHSKRFYTLLVWTVRNCSALLLLGSEQLFEIIGERLPTVMQNRRTSEPFSSGDTIWKQNNARLWIFQLGRRWKTKFRDFQHVHMSVLRTEFSWFSHM